LVQSDRLAREACKIEIDVLRKPIGIQDQYIAAYGGLRFLEFGPDEVVVPTRLTLAPDAQRLLDQNLLLFFTGTTRTSGSILEEQENNIRSNMAILDRLKALAHTARAELESGNVDAVGELMDEAWTFKKQLASKISNPKIDQIYDRAKQAGALGGKLTGAGGGGFLLMYCPVEQQASLRRVLNDMQELPFKTEPDGSKVIFNYQR